jgi:DNA repair exonuclease SbcCD ATPase subunit
MNELPFKNLASAREEYIKLSQELVAAKEALSQVEVLEADNSDLKVQLEHALKSVTDGIAQIASKDALIKAKDEELKILAGNLNVLTSRCNDLEKNAKSVKAQARELVAASAGAPAPVDNSELEMTENDLIRAMAAETDTKKLNALYRQFKAQRASK